MVMSILGWVVSTVGGSSRWLLISFVALILPLSATLVYAGLIGGWAGIGGGVLCVAAPMAAGALLGFLFGIPRTLQSDRSPAGGPVYQVNTNLEQISDWLTKILVGVGLTQLEKAPAAIQRTAQALQSSLGKDAVESVVTLVLVYFAVFGFFVGYLITRLVLTEAFSAADRRSNPDPAAVARVNDAPQGTSSSSDASEILRFRLEDLSELGQLTAWGKAQLQHGNIGQAVRAFERASALSGTAQGEADRRRVAEAQTLAALYNQPPSGFRDAIQIAEAYLAKPGHEESASLHAWLACAYGQAYAWIRTHPDAKVDAAELRKRALEEAKKALSLDPSWKPVLAGLLLATVPGGDDDLAAFRDDKEFRALLLES